MIRLLLRIYAIPVDAILSNVWKIQTTFLDIVIRGYRNDRRITTETATPSFWPLKVTKSKIELHQVLWLARYNFSENDRNTLWVFFSIHTNEGTPRYMLFNPQKQKD